MDHKEAVAAPPGAAAAAAAVAAIIEHPPHINRLLRLIREGTSDHAKRAATLLGRYAASCITGASKSSCSSSEKCDDNDISSIVISSNPSLIIWDLIGRLVGGDGVGRTTHQNNNQRHQQCRRKTNGTANNKQNNYNNDSSSSGLFDSNWSTRANCAVALEAVARCLPLEDRRYFFEWDGDRDSDSNQDKIIDEECSQDDNLWLCVNDLHRVYDQEDDNTGIKCCESKEKIKDNTILDSGRTTQLDVVVEKGRLLLSSSGEQYNWNCNDDHESKEYMRENEALKNLDATAVTATTTDNSDICQQQQKQQQKQKSFLQQRVALQRQILSRRLGLRGILSAPIMTAARNTDDDDVDASQPEQKSAKRRRIVDDIVTDEDLVTPSGIVPSSGGVILEQNHAKSTKDGNKPTQIMSHPIGIRALLVLESKRSSENGKEGRGNRKHARHRNPQTLLGSELAYRTFDSEWTVRHGALLGTLALLRAWRIHHDSTRTITTSKSREQQQKRRLGKWPHDILARCICILALDQFSDFSGVDLTTNDYNKRDNGSVTTDDFVSNAVVAPVREMAAQIIAILLEASPLDVWNCTHDLLMRLYNRKHQQQNHQERGCQWEKSHGVLLTWKYVIAITLFQSTRTQSKGITNVEERSSILRPLSARQYISAKDRYDNVINGIITHAIKEISDGNDDNRAVAAQLLRYCTRLESQLRPNDIVYRCSGPLWTAVTKIGDISSCAADLLSLLTELLSLDSASFLSSLREAGASFTFDSLLYKLSKFIDHDSAHVSISTFRAMSLIVEPITKSTSICDDDQRFNDAIHLAIGCVLNQIFETCYKPITGSSNEIGRVRDQAWAKILDSLPTLNVAQTSGVKSLPLCNLFVQLTLQYFRISREHLDNNITATPSAQEYSFDSYRHASQALALFYEKLLLASHEHSMKFTRIIAVVIETMIQSPWIDQCEAACLLMVALSTTAIWKGNNCEKPPDNQLLTSYLTVSPISILLKDHAEASLLLDDCNRFQCGDTFAKALDKMTQQDNHVTSDWIVQQWTKSLSKHGISLEELRKLPKATVSQTSMRLSASIAGAVTSCGCSYLPTKITPLIRTLLTSLKNEQSFSRRRVTCRYIADLVQILSNNDSYSKARNKLLENVCTLACERNTHSSQGATLAIEFLVENIGNNTKLQDFHPIWERLLLLRDLSRLEAATLQQNLVDSISLLSVVSKAMTRNSSAFAEVLQFALKPAVAVTCFNSSEAIRTQALTSICSFCRVNFTNTMDLLIPSLLPIMSDLQDDLGRKGGCELLLSILQEFGTLAAQYVPQLLPVSMRLMTDAIRECSKSAASIFAILVRLAPLASSYIVNHEDEREDVSNRVISHLILGRPMPPCVLPEAVSSQLKESGTVLRPYQVEGISWLKFLNDVKLNGALCDDMGLGKTLQSLVAVAISHSDSQASSKKKSLIVCPASVVGHWVNEIKRFFPKGLVLEPFAYTGTTKTRRASWSESLKRCNVIITSYSVLRTDVDLLENILWDYCILDEGHLLKNPKTATAKASRRVKARHKLILTGTPVQNNVNEVWATFDFLLPNFLGTEASFLKEFARPIIKSQAPDASAHDIDDGLDSLKILHQQVLPFILRREKMQVMNELPPKTITDIPCQLSKEQILLYEDILKASGTKDALEQVENALLEEGDSIGTVPKIGSDILKSLLQLRLICTHPLLHMASHKSDSVRSFSRLDCSGKLVALNDLLRHSGIVESEMYAADNDDSGFIPPDDNFDGDYDIMDDHHTAQCGDNAQHIASKCLIFAQFTQSLDIIEEYLFEPHIPSLQYLRLDGRIPPDNRHSIVERFNTDDNIKVLLLTTKVGGLGLNLTGADKVIFLEPDWNPFIDLQAQDRAHRIGQTKAVNIYRLITSNTIEEKIMGIQQRKKAVSDAVVNSENSTMYSMGTEKLLDIFTFRGTTSTSEKNGDEDNLLSYLDEGTNEYASSLSVDAFLGALS